LFATNIAGPFFAVYMLKNLQFSYLDFTILISAEVFASLLLFGLWGRFNDEKGSKRVLFITGMLIPFIPLLWLFGTNFYYLFLLQLFSGMVWSGFNLAAGNFIFDATTPEKRTRCVAYFNFIRGIAVFIGAFLGGLLLNFLTIPNLFLISGITRLFASIIFLPLLREMRLIEVGFGKSLFHDSVSIRPRQGIVHEAIGTYEVKDKFMAKKSDGILFPQKKNSKIKQISDKEKKLLEKQYLERLIQGTKQKK